MPGDKYTKAEKVGVDVPRAHNSQDDGDARSPGRIARSALPCVVHPWERTILNPWIGRGYLLRVDNLGEMSQIGRLGA